MQDSKKTHNLFHIVGSGLIAFFCFSIFVFAALLVFSEDFKYIDASHAPHGCPNYGMNSSPHYPDGEFCNRCSVGTGNYPYNEYEGCMAYWYDEPGNNCSRGGGITYTDNLYVDSSACHDNGNGDDNGNGQDSCPADDPPTPTPTPPSSASSQVMEKNDRTCYAWDNLTWQGGSADSYRVTVSGPVTQTYNTSASSVNIFHQQLTYGDSYTWQITAVNSRSRTTWDWDDDEEECISTTTTDTKTATGPSGSFTTIPNEYPYPDFEVPAMNTLERETVEVSSDTSGGSGNLSYLWSIDPGSPSSAIISGEDEETAEMRFFESSIFYITLEATDENIASHPGASGVCEWEDSFIPSPNPEFREVTPGN